MRQRSLLALAAGCLGAALPAVASAALLWTLVATPLTATVNVSTTFTLTATNLDPLTELGCLEVDLPSSFVIESLGTPTASHRDPWSSSQSGNAVIVRSLSGGGRLELGWSVSFTIRARGTVAGVFEWPNHAHRHQDCSTTDEAGVPLAVTILPVDPTPTPTPTPKPTAAPTPTASSTPIPLPSAPLPSIRLPILAPTPGPTATPPPTATPDPSTSPAASDGPAATAGGAPQSGGGTTDGRSGQPLQLARLAGDASGGADVGVELIGLLDTGYVWLVPAASVALPGLLVILFVGLQTVGALAWIPFVRRMGDAPDPRRRSVRPTA